MAVPPHFTLVKLDLTGATHTPVRRNSPLNADTRIITCSFKTSAVATILGPQLSDLPPVESEI